MSTPNLHFEVPQILGDYIAYIGTIDRQNPFTFYMTSNFSSKQF